MVPLMTIDSEGSMAQRGQRQSPGSTEPQLPGPGWIPAYLIFASCAHHKVGVPECCLLWHTQQCSSFCGSML